MVRGIEQMESEIDADYHIKGHQEAVNEEKEEVESFRGFGLK